MERNKHIKKKDTYLGKIIEISPEFYMSFQDYIVDHLEKSTDFLHYVLGNSFHDIFFDFVSYLQELYDFEFSLKKEDISHFSLEKHKQFTTKTYALKSGGFFNVLLLNRVFIFQPQLSDEVHYKDFEHFSNRCYDCGIYDDYIQIVLYSKLISAPNLQELEEEIIQLQYEQMKKEDIEKNTFEGFMRKVHKE